MAAKDVWIDYNGKRLIFKRLFLYEIQDLLDAGFKVHFRH